MEFNKFATKAIVTILSGIIISVIVIFCSTAYFMVKYIIG